MSWFSDFFSDAAAKTVDAITDGLDKLFTSDEERLQAKNIALQEVNKLKALTLSAQAQYDKEITERWKSDNEHGITRLVRPVSYAFILFVFAVIMFADGNIGEFAINEAYIPVIETLLTVMTIAYFGSRGWEKVSKTKAEK